MEKICAKIFAKSNDLIKEFKSYDSNGDGVVDYAEFLHAMKKHNLDLSEVQIYDLMRSLDNVNFPEISMNFSRIFAEISGFERIFEFGRIYRFFSACF